MYAARQNAIDAARALAEAGADLNLTDPDGTTALVFAIINGHFDLARLLRREGRRPERRRQQGHGGALCGRGHEHARRDRRAVPIPNRTASIDAAALVERPARARRRSESDASKAPVLERVHNDGDTNLAKAPRR